MRFMAAILDPYKDWILEHMDNYHTSYELMDALKENFGIDVNRNTLKSYFRRTIGRTTIYGTHEFSEKEKEIIKKYFPNNGAATTAALIDYFLNISRPATSVQAVANKIGIKCNPERVHRALCEKAKYSQQAKIQSVGTVRAETNKDGLTFYRMKAADGRWKPAGRVVWEQHNGPMPKDWKIIYLDGDQSNYNIENLYAAPNKLQYQIIRNKHYKSGNPEITKTLIKFYELRNALGMDCWEFQALTRKFDRLLELEGE